LHFLAQLGKVPTWDHWIWNLLKKSTPGDTHIIYFKPVFKCGEITLTIAQGHLKWTQTPLKQPTHMGNPSYNPMDLVRKHSPHPRAMVLVSPGPGSHPQTIPGACGMTCVSQPKSLLLVGTHIPNSSY